MADRPRSKKSERGASPGVNPHTSSFPTASVEQTIRTEVDGWIKQCHNGTAGADPNGASLGCPHAA